jgi:hypothetical protein
LGLGIELHGELEQIAGFGYGATDFYPYASGEFFGADFTQADPTVPADQVTISVTHSATLTMSIGIYAQLTFLQLINVEQEYDWDVTSLVGLGHPGQAYRDTALTGTNGQTPPITLAPTVVFELA